MEVRSDPSFNVAVLKSMSSSPFTAVQNTPVVLGDLPASQSFNENTEESVKRKRGRPRKYGPSDGPMGILTPPPLHVAGSSSTVRLESKKKKDKPLGSGKKHQMKALGLSGIGFTPHVITVKTGEDVSAKIMSFSNNGPRALCILSANGAISNVTLQQAATSGGTVTYEGRFEILSLSGSFLVSESSDQRSRTGGLSVSLAGPDGHVLGGGVAGLLIAATPVQVIVGSFIIEGDSGRKEPQQMIPLVGESEPGKPRPSSPISRGALNPSSGGGPGGSPHNQSFNGSDHNGNNNQNLPVMSWM
ncbi:hypothetical protein KFK09_017290 [Dendrobium nobile]|uniref:AT-hook motif nuclear-localized protein n=1 Tax=Dendrobium nobile TaxID=94219 RepID=A0A8T3B0L0_DENNO|nr:hypothetical protein KFK09_017284 [Dendrobium nobile]KAI0502342.1 hypothetical protein KFK09_017290 [Dendrobium nobile]